MNKAHFETQMKRLMETFSKQIYSAERVHLIWLEVKDLSEAWFVTCVDKLIGDCRYAPLLPEFRELTSIEREKQWERQKSKNRVESASALATIFEPQIVRSICKTIHKRMQGETPDQSFQGFVKSIEKLSNHPGECLDCGNSGICFMASSEGYEFSYRCHCVHGDRHSKALPKAKKKLKRVRETV